MPKRVVDGEGVWRSKKLKQVEPPSFRAEFANLVPLAFANGSFEADPDMIWSAVYSFNRPDITADTVSKILDEFQRVGMLFRWKDGEGRFWGYWTGIEKPGRLPGKSRRGTNERIGAPPPLESIRTFLDSICIQGHSRQENGDRPELPVIPTPTADSIGIQEALNGNEKLLGFGSGSGFGCGVDAHVNCTSAGEPRSDASVSDSEFAPAASPRLATADADHNPTEGAQYVCLELGLAGNELRWLIRDAIIARMRTTSEKPKQIAESMVAAWRLYQTEHPPGSKYSRSVKTFFSDPSWADGAGPVICEKPLSQRLREMGRLQ